jgi:predicted HTH domain antitoxin
MRTNKNSEITLGDGYLENLKELSETLHIPKSVVMKMVMEEGIRDLRMKIAMEKYLAEEFSLCMAAEFSGASIQQMARYLEQKGVPFFKYSIYETERDMKEAESWF